MLTQRLPQSPPPQSDSPQFNNNFSPSIFLIVLLAIIFFVSGLLHLLIRFLLRPSDREPEDFDNVTALQGQLQQLFHLHDAGVDQSLIDTLPVFHYKSIMGANDPFDCAVCLCEFEVEDKLRLLPNCSHAFHVECIDTWLLAHSTCPLCRASLLLDFSAINTCSSPPPFVNVHESGIQGSTDQTVPVPDGESSVPRSNSNLGVSGDVEILEKVVAIKLGKLRNVDGIQGCGGDDGNVDSRRCFSMGSFEYVMDENSLLQVPIRRIPLKKPSRKKNCPGRRMAMSECDCESRREFNGFDAVSRIEDNAGSKAVVKKMSKKESFSISKIWLRGKKDKQNPGVGSSRRAFSFRFPQHQNNLQVKNGTIDNNGNGSAIGCDEENQMSCHSMDLEAKTPSFAKRSVGWIAGRQNKVVHSSFTPNV